MIRLVFYVLFVVGPHQAHTRLTEEETRLVAGVLWAELASVCLISGTETFSTPAASLTSHWDRGMGGISNKYFTFTAQFYQ